MDSNEESKKAAKAEEKGGKPDDGGGYDTVPGPDRRLGGVYAKETDVNLCEHHTEHTEECGYVEAQAEIPCDKGCEDIDGDGIIDHAEDCAYTPAAEGQPCGYQCQICAEEADAGEGQDTGDNKADDSIGQQAKTATKQYQGTGIDFKVIDYGYSKTYSIYANGVPLILKEGTLGSNYTVIYADSDGDGNVTSSDIWAPEGMNRTEVGNYYSTCYIYGGGNENDLESDTSVTMLGGRVSAIYGGSYSSTVTGDTKVVVNGGTVSSVYGAGQRPSSHVTGDTEILIAGGTVGDNESGGVYGGGADGTVGGNTSVTVSGGNVGSFVCGGSSGSSGGNTGAVGGNTKVMISDGASVYAVEGGSHYSGTVAGSTEVIISGGTVTSASDFAVAGSGYEAPVSGSTSVQISGGSVNGRVFGTSYRSSASAGGNVSVSITGGEVTGYVLAKGMSDVIGEVSLTVGGNAKIGNDTETVFYSGIVLNGGTEKKGIDRFRIEPNLTGDAKIYLYLPQGYDCTNEPVVATEGTQSDIAYLEPIGKTPVPDEMGLYLNDNNDIYIGKPKAVETAVASVTTGSGTSTYSYSATGEYTTAVQALNAAWEAACEAGTATVTLLTDVTDVESSLTVGEGNNITFEGGDHTLFGSIAGNGIVKLTGGTLTVKNGTITNNGESEASGIYAEGGTIEITGGAINGYNGVYVGEGAILNMTGGEVHGTSYNGVVVYKGTANISGGTITGKENGVEIGRGDISGTAYISGDVTITSTVYLTGSGVYVAKNGTAEISGGTIASTGSGNGLHALNESNVTLTGGTFAAKYNSYYSVCRTDASATVGELLAEGYGYYDSNNTLIEDSATQTSALSVGTYGAVTVKKLPTAVATVTVGSDISTYSYGEGTGYTTAAEALNAAWTYAQNSSNADNQVTLKLLLSVDLGSNDLKVEKSEIQSNIRLEMEDGVTLSSNTTAIQVEAGNLVIASGTLHSTDGAALRVSHASAKITENAVLTASGSKCVNVSSGGNLLISGGTISYTGTVDNSHCVYVQGATVDMTSGEVNISSTNSSGIYISSDPDHNYTNEVTISGGSITGTANGVWNCDDESTLIVKNNAVIIGGTHGIASGGSADTSGKFVISGGTIISDGSRTSGSAIYVRYGEAQISGGTFTGEKGNGIYVGSNAHVSISGGTFTGAANSVWNDGGRVDALLADGCAYYKGATVSGDVLITKESVLSGNQLTVAGGYGTVTVAGEMVKIVTQPADQKVTYGYTKEEDPRLSIEAKATDEQAELTYQWYDGDGKKIDGATNKQYTVPSGLKAGEYKYYCKVTSGDYTVTSASATVIVDKRNVTPRVVGTTSKTYDGTAAGPEGVSLALTGTIEGDYIYATAEYEYKSADAGNSVSLYARKITLAGKDKDNYKTFYSGVSTEGKILQKELTVDVTVADKYYDGTKDAVIKSAALNGLVSGDENKVVLTNGTATFEREEAEEDIPVVFTAFGISGEAAGNYTLTQPTGVKASILEYAAPDGSYLVTKKNANGWMNTDFVVTAAGGYQIALAGEPAGEWTDKLTASEETADGELSFYVRDKATGAISVKVTETYKIDKTRPETVDITFNDNSVKKWINEVTFGLLFDKTVNVKITANDSLSGVASIWYYKSDKVLTEKEVNAITDWKNGSKFSVTAADRGKFVIYVKVEDLAGNPVCFASNGAEFDLTAPVIDNIQGGSENWFTDSRTVTFTVLDQNLDKVYYKSGAGSETELTEADGRYTFTADAEGNVTYTLRAVDLLGHETTQTVTVKIDREKPTIQATGNTTTVKQSDTVALDVTAGASGIVKVEASRDGGEYTDITDTYEKGYTVTENGTYTFRVTNGAGVTAEDSLIYEKIDHTKPVVEIDSNGYEENTWATKDITLTASNTAGNVGTTKLEYKVGEGEWEPYTEPVVIAEDCDDTTYTFRAVSESGLTSEEASIVVKRDTELPTGTVSIADNWWKEFLNTITFNLFFKETQTVKVTTDSDRSGIVKVEYYESASGLTREEVETVTDWTEGSRIPVTAEDAKTFVYYIRLTDPAGNVNYLSTDGAEFDLTAPVIDNIQGGSENWFTDSQTVTFTVSDQNLDKVYYKSGAGSETELTEADGRYTFTADAEGNVTYTLRAVDLLGHETTETVTVKIDRKEPTIQATGNTTTVKQSDAVALDITAGASGIAKVEVSRDGGEYVDITDTYESGYTVTENGIYTFRVTNGAGVTAEDSLIYEKIDHTKPVVEINSNGYEENTWATENITLTASNTAGNVGTTKLEYKVGEGEWEPYTEPVVISEDCDETTYTFRAISESGLTSEEASIVVKRDTEFPTGTVSIAGNQWRELLDTITFDLFFRETQTVEVTTDSDRSGIVTVEYYESASGLTREEVEAVTDWKEGSSIPVTAEDAKKFVYYIRLTDPAGNVNYLSTDGAEFDLTAPIIANIQGVPEGWSAGGQTVTFEIDEKNLDSVSYRVGEGELLPLTENGGVYAFEAEADGEVTYTIYAVDKAGNEATETVTVKIDREEPTIRATGDVTTVKPSDTVKLDITAGASGIAKVEVSRDGGEYVDITDTYESGYTVTENGAYTFRITNGAGVIAEDSLTYEHIKADTPKTPDSSGGNDEKNRTMKTGDDTHLWLWLAVLLVAGGVILGGVIRRRKRTS